jgi:hypothetical protein
MPEVKSQEDWMQKKWRPAMGWMYMGICTLDMGIFPILWSILQTVTHQPITQWQPLTLQGAGLFHIAMGAVLGIAAFGRTQEKIAGAASNTMTQTSVPQQQFISTPQSTQQPIQTNTFGNVPLNNQNAFDSAPTTQVTTGFGGKAVPPQMQQPAI